jgi:hypothetical protein
MEDETFAGHRQFFWMWACLVALVVMIAFYLADQPIGGKNGGTTLGYVYGGIASAGILFLMWYGMRRRHAYASGSGTLKGWLSAHVWIGVALTLVVPMHAGFKVARNLHSMPYLLMLLTCLSGVWGAWSYMRYPARMRAQREGSTTRGLVEQLDRASREIAMMVQGKSAEFAAVARQLDVVFSPSTLRIVLARRYPMVTRERVYELLGTLPRSEYATALELTKVAYGRRRVANLLIDEAGMAARMRVWLYLHVPLSFACVAAVLAHVFWVLFYRWSAR